MSITSLLSRDSDAILAAMGKSQAIIEFDLDGKILRANENFCAAIGYELSEIVGQHHRMFVDPAEASSQDYADFWRNLAAGKFDRRQYKRIAKGGREIWIEASYNPVFKGGKPYKVVKFATDITAAKLRSAEDAGKLEALSRAQAVIEFSPSGEILSANQNFLSTVGYELSEIIGRHHQMFCEADYARSTEYQQFWSDLRNGQFAASEFKRIGKGGRIVHIQASYNPIFDPDGRVFKVVKFATDITDRVGNVSELAGGLQQLSAGNLTRMLPDPFIPELEQLRSDYNHAVEKLQTAMRTVGENAHAIAAGSSQVRSAADDLSRRTEQQAASVEQTAAALEEITTTVANASSKAEESGRLVAETRKSAMASGEVVQKTIGAIGAIEKSSTEISSIIGVIDDIAFQTNLLALNAGVEAARAGEAGKGFAVVAQEVRELAQRSANAAKEIKALINTSGEQVKSGVILVGETGQALQKIVDQVQAIDANVQAIVQSSREQAIGLKEINNAVSLMDQGTQQNAAMVEESTAASHSLAREADALFRLLGTFELGGVQRQERGPVQSRAPAQPSAANRSERPVPRKVAGGGGASWQEF
ncbi:MAG: PAS domain-containing methyl-accepting chemotaxis protein [Rhizobium sp.]|nr:PAS domain-containing methyl-accepting chemotaxis protein [Rhizobium sp.]